MIKTKLPRLVIVGGALAAAMLATTTFADPFGRGALRSVVAACLVSKSTLGLSFPCNDVRLDSPGRDGYAVIRSPGFASEYLLSPLAAYDGIESPQLQTDSATDLWQAAWDMRDGVDSALGRKLPRTDLALAVNASGTRTQDHFHIHLDCLRASVGKTLDKGRAAISDKWARLRTPLRGQTYWARTIAGPDLAGVNVPRLIASAPPAADHPMNEVTLAVVGATLTDGSDGFYLLASWQNISAERLLDHDCRTG
jgi:CDP-diacylglycerol pyrophosphatase